MLSTKRVQTLPNTEFQAATAPDREIEAIMLTWKGNRNYRPQAA